MISMVLELQGYHTMFPHHTTITNSQNMEKNHKIVQKHSNLTKLKKKVMEGKN